jgi:hypothetical protein
MMGYCDSLAIALSAYAGLPIRAMYPVHIKADGTERTDPDFLHVYVMDKGQAWDAKGRRPESDVADDFKKLLRSLKRSDEVGMRIAIEDYTDGDDLIESAGCDTSNVLQALRDAVTHLGVDEEGADLTARMFKKARSAQPW